METFKGRVWNFRPSMHDEVIWERDIVPALFAIVPLHRPSPVVENGIRALVSALFDPDLVWQVRKALQSDFIKSHLQYDVHEEGQNNPPDWDYETMIRTVRSVICVGLHRSSRIDAFLSYCQSSLAPEAQSLAPKRLYPAPFTASSDCWPSLSPHAGCGSFFICFLSLLAMVGTSDCREVLSKIFDRLVVAVAEAHAKIGPSSAESGSDDKGHPLAFQRGVLNVLGCYWVRMLPI